MCKSPRDQHQDSQEDCVGIHNKAHTGHTRDPQFKESTKDGLDCVLRWGASCTWVRGDV